jgi:lipoprotein-releasing system ATP-binding protein
MLEVKNINHNYGKDIALKDVNLQIAQGEFVSLIGESGSGKSTLLSILSTLLKPSFGELSLFGEKSTQIKDIDRLRREKIGFVFQFHYLINYLTVRENIALATSKENESYIDELLEYLEITEIQNKYPNEISGGQRQRAAIARAIANKPKVIFADEPTGNLDSKNSLKVFELLKDISKKGTTIIVATHDTKLAKSADTIYEVNDGTISKCS